MAGWLSMMSAAPSAQAKIKAIEAAAKAQGKTVAQMSAAEVFAVAEAQAAIEALIAKYAGPHEPIAGWPTAVC